MEVVSLEDVYWVEDNAARAALGKDLPRWIQARQTLPTSKEDLDVLKADLWSSVVKNSQHQDAWTWGEHIYNFFFFLVVFFFRAPRFRPPASPLAPFPSLGYSFRRGRGVCCRLTFCPCSTASLERLYRVSFSLSLAA